MNFAESVAMQLKTLFCLCAVALLTGLSAGADVTTLNGEIEGARYSIQLPDAPNGKVLLLAHGYWPEGVPWEANDQWTTNLTQALVADGWIVGFTTYRRNGWIMEEAGRDLENLHALVSAATRGKPGKVYLMGDSMGGGISTRLAENPAGRFAGVLAMGAYLYGPIGDERTDSETLGAHFSTRPKIPILFLTNSSELDGPKRYVQAAAAAPVPPALWRVNRSGHVNLNQAEQQAALLGLVHWVETGEIELSKDATIEMNPTSTATFDGKVAKGVASRLVPIYGNFISSFVREDFQRLGIQFGDTFELTVAGMTVPVLLGRTYNDVAVGEWVGFWDADGYLLISRNYKNAVATTGLKPDAEVFVRGLK